MDSIHHEKKTYTPPVLIDLSIEGITGIGAGTCSTGPEAGIAGCSKGTGAGTSCVNGWEVGTGCTDGGFPYEAGGVCYSDGLTTSSCQNGPDAATGSGRCLAGISAVHTTANPTCIGGLANTNMCGFGNGNDPGPGSS